MRRREFLALSGGAIVASGALLSGCRRPPSKADVIEELVANVLAPDLRLVQAQSAALEQSIQRWIAEGDSAKEAVHERFRSAVLAWQRAQAFRIGPIVESNALVRSAFWPARGAQVMRLLTDGQQLSKAQVASLGVDAKGLFALELLLFSPELPAEAQRTRELALLYAGEIRERSQGALGLLGDGRALSATLSKDPQQTLERIVNIFVETCETAAMDRIERVLSLQQHGRLHPTQVQGGWSGLTFSIPGVWLDTMQRIFAPKQGRGIATLLADRAAGLEQRTNEAFRAASAGLKLLSSDLKHAATSQQTQIEVALAATKKLEMVLKTELTSALGVTLSIVSGDGD